MNIPEIIKSACGEVSYTIAIDFVIFLAGLLIFGNWLLKTSLGRKSLSDSVPRRNNMPLYLPFVSLFIWFGAVSLATSVTEKFLPALQDWQKAFLDNLILCIGEITAIAAVVLLARASFARRLKGFGVNFRTIHKDIPAALLNLVSVWPLIAVMLILTMHVGKLIIGPDFELQPHEELETIRAYSQLPVRALIIVTAIAIVPVFEEMLFRGLFQTMLRSILAKPWPSIAISSGLFVLAHSNAGHWPALFVLSVCMGYSYEKSGSLLRPIFIHAIFNAISIIGTLYNI
ncbi:MAG: type II CAAX endopeptidase family protein [Phycisphaerae bacterium]|nr:type II CAAX endopeptidase family protein [Phycisphaerae bacterium]MDD5381107.1 type II CAAX endopeptidase family protein [Phycisphaerae bacterium]